MMKKIIGIILAVSMLFTMTSFAEGTAAVSTADTSAIEILDALGALDSMGFGVLDADIVLSRSQFIQLIISITFPEFDGAGKDVSPFSDVAKGSEGYGELCAAYDMRLVSGDGNGKFNPDHKIEFESAVKIIMTLLGYEADAALRGGYPTGYCSMARMLGVDSALTTEEKTSFTFAAAAKLLLGALETEVKEVKGVSIGADGGYAYYLRVGETLMYNALKVRKGRGILKLNHYTELTNPVSDNDYTVQIGSFTGKMYGPAEQEQYIGYEVEFYYQETERGNVVLYMEPTDNNEVVDINLGDASYSGRRLDYYNDAGTRRYSADIPASAMIICNGKAITDYSKLDALIAKAIDIGDGSIKLVDNDDDGIYEVVNINMEKNLVVQAVDIENEFIADKFTNANALDLKDAGDWVFWDKNYKNIELADIAEGMVITYIRNDYDIDGDGTKDGDGEYVRGMISGTVVDGEVSKVWAGGKRQILEINSVEYKLSGSLNKEGIKFGVGDKVTAYINYRGEIVAMKRRETTSQYGYIIAAQISDEAFGDYIQLKMLLESGGVQVVDCARSLKIDGVQYKTTAELNTACALLNTPQVVKYLLNSDEKVIQIDRSELAETADENTITTDNSLLHLMPPNGSDAQGRAVRMQYFTQPKLFVGAGYGIETTGSSETYGQLVISTSTKVMVVPDPDAIGKKDDDYFFTSLTYFAANGDFYVQGFVNGKDEFYPELLLVESTGQSETTGANVVFVTGKYTTLDSDENEVDAITAMTTAGATKEFTFASGVSSATLGEGDVVDLALNMRGNVAATEMIYDASAGTLMGDYQTIATYHSSAVRPEIGYVYSVEGDNVAFSTTEPTGTMYYKDLMFMPIASSTKVYVFENTGREIKCKLGSKADIQDYKSFGKASKIFYYTTQAVVRMVVIYK